MRCNLYKQFSLELYLLVLKCKYFAVFQQDPTGFHLCISDRLESGEKGDKPRDLADI